MGIAVDNMKLIVHRQASFPGPEFQIGRHKADDDVDDVVVISSSNLASLRGAARQGQPCFDDVLAAVVPAFYSSLSSTARSTLRNIFLDLDALPGS